MLHYTPKFEVRAHYVAITDCSTCTTIKIGQTIEAIAQWPLLHVSRQWQTDKDICVTQMTVYDAIFLRLRFQKRNWRHFPQLHSDRRILTENIRIILKIRRQSEKMRDGWVLRTESQQTVIVNTKKNIYNRAFYVPCIIWVCFCHSLSPIQNIYVLYNKRTARMLTNPFIDCVKTL